MVDAAAVILWFAVAVYAVFGGAALGAGLWALVCSSGEKGDRPRSLIRHAVGPVWEASHVWLLLALLVLWTVFPEAFDSIRATMAVPMVLVATAILLRGVAYVLGGAASSPGVARAWSRIWSVTSVVAPFLLGAVLGGVASGRVAVGGDGGSVEAWLNPTSVLVGLVAVALAAFEGAIHLASEASRYDDVRLEHSLRHRAVLAAAAAGALGVVGVFVLGEDAPYLRHGLTDEGLPLVVAAALLGVAAVATLRLGAGRRTHLLAAGAVASLVWAWGLAQYPYVVPETLTLDQAAAGHDTVTSAVVGFGLVSAALVVVLGLLHLFDQRGRAEAGASAYGGSGGGGSGRHRVVIVGGGFGGLPAAQLLGYRPVDVVLVDRRNHHLFQPLLYQVATGILSPGQIAAPLRHVLRRHKNVTVEMAEVTGVDLEAKVVHAMRFFQTPMEIPYDSLIVAAGAGQSYFGHDEFSLFAPGMKTVDDALEIRRRVLGALEMAETAPGPEERDTWMTMVIVGAGPTGVELAGQIRELAVRSLKGDFRRIDPTKVRVVLVDGGAEPLATFGDALSMRAAHSLERMGVKLMMGARVTGVDGTGVDVLLKDGSERIASHTVIWAAGVQASPLGTMLAEATGAELDRAGRISVLPDLTLPGHPEVFVVGDMISLNHLPGVAEVAMQGGLHAANSILRRLRGEAESATLPFRYRDLGSLATIGRFRAVMSFGKIRLSGFPAWVAWCFVHLAFLTSFGNRFTTILRWAGAMIGRSRSERSFSVGRTAGDVSMPDKVRAAILPPRFPGISGEGDHDGGDLT